MREDSPTISNSAARKVQRFQRLTCPSKLKIHGHALIPNMDVSRFFLELSAAWVVSIALSACALTPGPTATPAEAPAFKPLQVDVASANRWMLSTEARF